SRFQSGVSRVSILPFAAALLSPHNRRMDKEKVAEVLVEIGVLLELQGENPFKTRAYSNAARTIEALSEPLAKIVAEERLGELKGIGDGIQKKITELVTTGKLKYYDELKASVPAGLVEMLDIPGVGPKKIQVLLKKLGIDSVEKLEAAAKAGKIAVLEGFGEKTEKNILDGINQRRTYDWRASARRQRKTFSMASTNGGLMPRNTCCTPHGVWPSRCWKVCDSIQTLFAAAQQEVCGAPRK